MPLPDPDRCRAVLLGTSTYQDDNLPPIPAVAKNLEDLQAALSDPDTGVLPSDNCTTLLDVPDLSKLEPAISGAEDVLLVYFAGHGIVGRRHELYLGMPASNWASPAIGSFPYSALRDIILDSPAATKIVILDCCYSGRAIGDALADDASAIVGQLEVDGTYLLASAHKDQVSLAIPDEEHTAFTGRLLSLLKYGVPGGPELLTIDDLYRQLRVTMQRESLPIPQKRGTRTADLLPLARNRAFTPTPVQLLRQRFADAETACRAGNWAATIPELRDILVEQESIVGERHEDTLRTRQFLANATGAAGNPKEAAKLLEELLAEQLATIGPDHPVTVRTREFLAVNLGEAGRRAEAIAILRPLLADRRRIVGADDPAPYRTQHVLARNLAMSGSFTEAAALLRELVSARERLLGIDHPDTELSRRDLDTVVLHASMAVNNV